MLQGAHCHVTPGQHLHNIPAFATVASCMSTLQEVLSKLRVLSFPMLPCAGKCRSAQAAACRLCRCKQRSRVAPGVTGSRCVCLLL